MTRDLTIETEIARDAFDVMRALPCELAGERTTRVIRHVVGLGYEKIELRGPSRRRLIRGVASTGRICEDNYSLSSMGCVMTLPIPLLFAHGHLGKKTKPESDDLQKLRIGEVVLLKKNRHFIQMEAVIDDSEAGKYAWKLIEDGAVSALSVRSSTMQLGAVVDDVSFYDRWTLDEISICRSGRNPEAYFEIAGNYGVDFV